MQSINLYQYCISNPVRYVDPSGNDLEDQYPLRRNSINDAVQIKVSGNEIRIDVYVVNQNTDYHWYVYDEISRNWYNKNGMYLATNQELHYIDGKYIHGDIITDYKHAASLLNYNVVVGEYYITRRDGSCFE